VFSYTFALEKDFMALNSQQKQKRNRLISLSFVSVLLLLVYGPLAQWFVAADRVIYDQLASHLPNKPLENAVIISIDPSDSDADEVSALYGRLIEVLNVAEVNRIIMTQPPEMPADRPLPGWAAAMNDSVPVYTPTRHRLADVAARDGFIDINSDSDGVLRRADLWQLNDGVMSPSLPLAVAFDSSETSSHYSRLSGDEDAIYLSNYAQLPRVEVEDLLNPASDKTPLRGATVFLDSSPALVGAVAMLPSGQFVTLSEITAALLADVEQNRSIISPSWVKAFEWLAPALLAIVAVLFMPDRSRKDIAVMAGVALVALLLFETLLLYVLHTRLDLGRPSLIFSGVAILSIWLVGDETKELKDAFKKGNDFLAAGRLEPAFAEFRRCVQTFPCLRGTGKTRARRGRARVDEAHAWNARRRFLQEAGKRDRAAAAGTLRHRAPHRARRNGRRLPGQGPTHQSTRGPQGHSDRERIRGRRAQGSAPALLPRGRIGRPPGASQYHHRI
jgi:hypothetical protein